MRRRFLRPLIAVLQGYDYDLTLIFAVKGLPVSGAAAARCRTSLHIVLCREGQPQQELHREEPCGALGKPSQVCVPRASLLVTMLHKVNL